MNADFLLAQKLFDAGDALAARDKCLAILAQDEEVGEAHQLLGIIAKQAGNIFEAASHFIQVLNQDAADNNSRRNLFDTLQNFDWFEDAEIELVADIRRHLEAGFRIPDFDMKRYLPVVAAAIQASEPFQQAIKFQGTLAQDQAWIAELMADPLLQALLKTEIVPIENFESVLTRMRVYLLETAANAPELLDTVRADFCIALAHQTYLTEYAYLQTEDEINLAQELVNGLQAKNQHQSFIEHADTVRLAVSACYLPLGEWLEKLPAGVEDTEFQSLAQLQIYDPQKDEALANKFEAPAPASDSTSQEVQAQYEQNPFPRWSIITRPAASSITATLQFFFPHFEPAEKLSGPCDILIAGCGTGQQPILEALRYPDSHLTAFDLSRASLAYAARKAKDYEAGNIDFLIGDILELEGFDNFDVIECTGVLHHMADPLAGWRALIAKLAPSGVMKIALYSEFARRHITATQQWIKAQDLMPTADVIRDTRRKILALPADDPKRQVTAFSDFYSISGVRDLLFHVQESTFTFLKIKEVLQTLNLQLIGLQISNDKVKGNYLTKFPGDTTMTNLDNWHEFESENPDSFKEMYIFWCRAL